MGRPSLSAEAIANNRIRIINTAMEMIREDGISSVTARSLGSRVGMNSALIYRYFEDIDEVVLFACVHVLQEYTREMADASRDYEEPAEDISDLQIYYLSWELFCKHAFKYPEEYNTLFFSRHSGNLSNIISEYYRLFPHDRGADDDIILEGMYRSSNLRNRNLMLLIPVLEGKKSEREIILINDMTVSFFYVLLFQLIGRDKGITAETQTARMLESIRLTTQL
ncbi:MAG: TetR/AcrR family transcriptional regulator [Mogibacterium sp.]|nr:TetR/AcrR family transcriptional regulator [Mogibacterium sp.]